jgi:hypothetical protein
LFVESPLAFRRRLLFVSRSALTRASMLAEPEAAKTGAAAAAGPGFNELS